MLCKTNFEVSKLTNVERRESFLKKLLSNKSSRLAIYVLLITQLLTITFYFFYKSQRSINILEQENSIVLFIALFALLTIIMVVYLQGSSKFKNDYSEKERYRDRFDDNPMIRELFYISKEQAERTRMEFREFKEQISRRLEGIGELNSIVFTDEDKEKLLGIIESKVEKSVADRVIQSFEENYAKSAILQNNYKELLHEIDRVNRRLNNEIARLSLRANLNLAIGSATTIIAILILYLTVVNQDLNFDSFNESLSFFIPRISIVVFIEIFSFFFLKIYKSNLSDIKYYQNEITNADFKVFAMKAAFAKGDEAPINDVIKEFSSVERNFIIKKGESTVEIEKNKLDLESDNSWKEIIKEALKMKN